MRRYASAIAVLVALVAVFGAGVSYAQTRADVQGAEDDFRVSIRGSNIVVSPSTTTVSRPAGCDLVDQLTGGAGYPHDVMERIADQASSGLALLASAWLLQDAQGDYDGADRTLTALRAACRPW